MKHPLRVLSLPIAWAIAAACMVGSYLRDPGSGLTPENHYGHNSVGSLVPALEVSVIELAVLLAILRPWSYARSWSRGLMATIVLIPWTVLSLFWTVHAGGVLAVHFLWVFVALIGIGAATVRSGFSALRGK